MFEKNHTTGEDAPLPPIRPELLALPEQIEELFKLDVQVAAANPEILPLESPSELADFLMTEHTSNTYVLRDKAQQLIASASVVDQPAQNTLELLNIGVLPTAQRGGYGSVLLNFVEDLARELSRQKIALVTSINNTQALNFYQKNGFQIVARVEDVYTDGRARFLLEKPLADIT